MLLPDKKPFRRPLKSKGVFLVPRCALYAASFAAVIVSLTLTFFVLLREQEDPSHNNHHHQDLLNAWKIASGKGSTAERIRNDDDDDDDDNNNKPQSLLSSMDESTKTRYPTNDGNDVGVLSRQPTSFFRVLQRQIDESDDDVRCRRYGFTTTPPSTTTRSSFWNALWRTQPPPPLPTRTHKKRRRKRRIFYGSLLADEPWELLEIVAAETYGIFHGMVFVESNRTQNFTPRRWKRINHTATLATLFGTPHIQVRTYVNEDDGHSEKNSNKTMWREHAQRQEILRGWKELGMQPNDVAYLGDTDETFTRDFLRAVQRCYVRELDYEATQCHYKYNRLSAATRMYFSSPECMARDFIWYHPDLTLGHCVEGIGDAAIHPVAPRVEGYKRAPGFGQGCRDRAHETKISALWNAADFRINVCGSGQRRVDTTLHPELDLYTGFHFHNFFAHAEGIRFKYSSYGHPKKDAYTKNLLRLGSVAMVWQCTQNLTDAQIPSLNRRPEPGKFAGSKPFWPIYFQDADYRQRRHEMVSTMLQQHDDGRPFEHRGTPPMMNMRMTGGQLQQGQMILAAEKLPPRG
eukprot:scaffold34623_cov274-Amphora_coffeaeformis.AAC.14